MSDGRVATALAVGLRERARNHVLLGLVVLLPVYFVALVDFVAPDRDVPVWVGVDGATVSMTQPMGEIYVVVATPMVCALAVGIAGMFTMQNSGDADGRLVLAGYRPWEVVLSRLLVVASIALVVTASALAVLWFVFEPSRPGWFVAAALLAGLTYGMVGVVVGSVLDTLGGTYAMLFAPMLDVLVFQNPMITRGDPAAWTTYLPAHYPMGLAFDAAYTDHVRTADVWWAVAYLGLLVVVATLLFHRATRIES